MKTFILAATAALTLSANMANADVYGLTDQQYRVVVRSAADYIHYGFTVRRANGTIMSAHDSDFVAVEKVGGWCDMAVLADIHNGTVQVEEHHLLSDKYGCMRVKLACYRITYIEPQAQPDEQYDEPHGYAPPPVGTYYTVWPSRYYVPARGIYVRHWHCFRRHGPCGWY